HLALVQNFRRQSSDDDGVTDAHADVLREREIVLVAAEVQVVAAAALKTLCNLGDTALKLFLLALLLLLVLDLLDGLDGILTQLDDKASAEAVGADATKGRHLVLSGLDDGRDEV